MAINSHEFLEFVIQPALAQLGETSTIAKRLLLATACYETEIGSHLVNDKGLGIFAISESLHKEVWDKFIALDCDLASRVRGMASQHEFPKQPHQELITNLLYSAAIAWMVYQYRMVELPQEATAESLADCWQKYYVGGPINREQRSDFITCFNKIAPQSKPIAA